MADEILDPPGNAGDTTANLDPNGSKTVEKPAPIYTKEDLTRITSREVGAVREKLTAAEAELAKFKEMEEADRVAKLSKEQREKEALAKEKAATEAMIADLKAQAAAERTARIDTVRSGRAASLAGSVAAQLANPDLMPHVEAVIARALVVEPVEGGGERVVITLGAAGDVEPLESGFAKFRDKHLAPFFKVAGGSGGRHGAGAANGAKAWAHLSPTDRIASGLTTGK